MEYDECTVNADSPIPRLVFIRTTTPIGSTTDIANPQTASECGASANTPPLSNSRTTSIPSAVQRRVDGTGHDRACCMGTCRRRVHRDAIALSAPGSELLSESEAYHLLSDADACATFEGAKVLLDRINPSQFADPDLVTCIVFSKKLVEFCLMAGVPRDASDRVSSFWAMMQEVNVPSLIRHVSREGFLKTLGTALEIRRQINQYPDMMWRLSQKHGPGKVVGHLPR